MRFFINSKTHIIGAFHISPKANLQSNIDFSTICEEVMFLFSGSTVYICGDFNMHYAMWNLNSDQRLSWIPKPNLSQLCVDILSTVSVSVALVFIRLILY